MSFFILYRIGVVLLIIGIAIAAYLLNVPAAAIVGGIILLVALVLLRRHGRTEPKDLHGGEPF